jgi:hypothetical protein
MGRAAHRMAPSALMGFRVGRAGSSAYRTQAMPRQARAAEARRARVGFDHRPGVRRATVAAWSADVARLSELASVVVRDKFLDLPANLKTDWIHYRCDGVAGSNYCTLRNGDGDSVTLRVSSQYLGAAHAAVELPASLTSYPANGEQYVSEFVRAWAAGNTPRMRALGKPDVVVAVNDNHQDRPQGVWPLATVPESGGAGLLLVHVDVGEGSVHFTLHVGTTLLGTPHAIVGYEP